MRSVAAGATLHCLTGCALGEIIGLVLGTIWSLSSGATVALSIGLAFVFGYSLSLLPLRASGLSLGRRMRLVLAADTLSIATMEIVDNLVMLIIPGAMGAGIVNPIFWVSMAASLMMAFLAALPVNVYLLRRGQGHALTHEHHSGHHKAHH